LGDALETVVGEPQLNADVAAFHPSELSQRLPECCDLPLNFRVGFHVVHQHADAPHRAGPLCARRERPRRHRTAEQRNELAALQLTELHFAAPSRNGSIAD